MNEYELKIKALKIKALLEGLEIQNIEKFMREARVGDYRNLGKAYITAARKIGKENAELKSIISELGFNVIELIGFMEMTKEDLINQFKGLAEQKVDVITKQAVKKE